MPMIATFALGCFWDPDFYFSHLPGVLNVTVGYSGGTSKNPTYENIGNHSEAIQIEYDPEIISYEDLLKHFFARHNPVFAQSRRYRSAIFYQNSEQKELAEKAVKEYEKEHDVVAETSVERTTQFYPAEEYHQKYYEKHHVRGVCP